ncbi:hypothetical protein Tco_1002954 [Tanacetum coccineum]|uniref:Uncharacterized protein n=1 Tax=Tanacetum coccineum TaxID=301880 RepID=A0ABQ5F7R1_9ASTR
MVVQNQVEIGEGSAMPTDPHHIPTIIQPSPQPEKKLKPRKPKRKDTQIPQSSDPTKHVVDKAVYKERGDSLVRATTTASSLEAEHDSGNIAKTQSKETPNESSSLGTTSGGGPRCQKTMGDIIAQTRFENVSKLSNYLLLVRGNKLRSGEGSLKLKELVELCTNLQQRVLDLEKEKTTQAEEIFSLKRRVKSLNKKRGQELMGLKGRINAIDADEDITLVNDQDDADMFNVNTLTVDEVLAEQEVTAKDVNLTVDEVTLAQALAALKSVKPKVKANVIEESSVPVSAVSASTKVSAATTTTATLPTPRKGIFIAELDDIQAKVDIDYQLAQRLQAEEQEQFTTEQKATLFKELLEQRRKHFAAKRAVEKRNKPPTQAQQRKIIASKRVNTFVDFRIDLVEGSSKKAGDELEQEVTKKQKVDDGQETAEVDDDQETSKIKELIEIVPDEEEVAIDAIPLTTKPPTIVDWKIYKKGKKNYYQIIRADESSKMYLVFSHMLKSFDREDLETLWKLIKAKYRSTRPVEDLDLIISGDLKTMFEPHVEYRVWKNQQDYRVLD